MTEKKEIEPKAEATLSHRIRPIFKKDIRNPCLPLIHPSYCMFTEPITIITEEPADGKDHCFDLVVFDLIDGDRSATVETIAYEDLLLAHMAILFEDDREKFLRYQISIHTDPETWLEELRRFWINFEKEIITFENERFYNDYLLLINKVSGKTMKKVADFTWEGNSTQLIELALALEASDVIKYDRLKHSQNQFIEAFSDALHTRLEMKKIEDLKKKIIARKGVATPFVEILNDKFESYMTECRRK